MNRDPMSFNVEPYMDMPKPFDVNEIDENKFPRISNLAKKLGVSLSAEELTLKRHITHGTFADNAMVAQAFKSVARMSEGWAKLDDVEKEAMDMVFSKFSRILSGKSMAKEHWEDVEGYSHLVCQAIDTRGDE